MQTANLAVCIHLALAPDTPPFVSGYRTSLKRFCSTKCSEISTTVRGDLARFASISESRSSSLVPLIEKQGTIQLF